MSIYAITVGDTPFIEYPTAEDARRAVAIINSLANMAGGKFITEPRTGARQTNRDT
jgi:hypothetical protein